MNAEEMELARRFVACKGWVWLRGMRWVRKSSAPSGGMNSRSVSWPFEDVSRHFPGAVPDLSDALTRAGLLEVVRRAWGMPHCGLWGNNRLGPSLRWACGEANGRIFTGETEIAALLAALEAAP